MSIPILSTKLYIPFLRPNLVSRPGLIEQLNEGLHHKLTVISAPAGFGKTTLVSEWLNNLRLDVAKESQVVNRKSTPALRTGASEIQNRVAWLSLDEGDNASIRFLTYFIAALQQIDLQIGLTAQRILQAPQPPAPEALITTLINDMIAVTDKSILVLDDYHLIDTRPIHQALSFCSTTSHLKYIWLLLPAPTPRCPYLACEREVK